jgi:hypothetical protein
MKLTADRPLADPDVAARKIMEIANAIDTQGSWAGQGPYVPYAVARHKPANQLFCGSPRVSLIAEAAVSDGLVASQSIS